jgi:ornithine cyclodeaminase
LEIATAAVLGSGVQAYWQVLALHRERPYRSLIVWARDLRKADELVRRHGQRLPGVNIRASGDLPHAVNAADVLITTTLSKEPLIRAEWLREGQHITAVGADDPTKCELEPSVLLRARLRRFNRSLGCQRRRLSSDTKRALSTRGA